MDNHSSLFSGWLAASSIVTAAACCCWVQCDVVDCQLDPELAGTLLFEGWWGGLSMGWWRVNVPTSCVLVFLLVGGPNILLCDF